jgi:hypothetical protein
MTMRIEMAEGEPAKTEWTCREEVDPLGALDSAAG